MSHTPHASEVQYLNLRVNGPLSTVVAESLPARTYVSRAGPILEDSGDYYVAVVRARFTVDIPVAIAPIGPDFTADGVSTDWSITVKYTSALGVVSSGRAYLKVTPPAIVTGQTAQPLGLYMAIYTLTDFQNAINIALASAYATCNAAAGGVLPATRGPFVGIAAPGAGRLAMTVYPFDLYNVPTQAAPGPKVELFCSWSSFPAFSGWDLKRVTQVGQPLSPIGADYRFNIASTGMNYSPLNAAGSESLTPTAPASTAIIWEQVSPCLLLPGVVSVNFLSSISSVPEYSPGEDGRDQTLQLSDQSPDLSGLLLGDARTSFYFNSGLDGARWARINGRGMLSNFVFRVVLTDWLGRAFDYELSTRAQAIDVKLAFAPTRVVEGSPAQ